MNIFSKWTVIKSVFGKNPRSDYDVTIFLHDVIVIFYVVFLLLLLSILVTGPGFMSISSLGSGIMTISFITD